MDGKVGELFADRTDEAGTGNKVNGGESARSGEHSHGSSFRFQNTGHLERRGIESARVEGTEKCKAYIFDGEDVDSTVNKLLSKVEVVCEVVFARVLASDISSVTLEIKEGRQKRNERNGAYKTHDSSFDNSTSLLGSVDSKAHVLDVVKRIKDTEDIESVFDGSG